MLVLGRYCLEGSQSLRLPYARKACSGDLGLSLGCLCLWPPSPEVQLAKVSMSFSCRLVVAAGLQRAAVSSAVS